MKKTTTMILFLLTCYYYTSAQQGGHLEKEDSPCLKYVACDSTDSGSSAALLCVEKLGKTVLDANWRLIHDVSGYKKCEAVGGGGWDAILCPDEKACARNCALEGISQEKYRDEYGVTTVHNELSLQYDIIKNKGSRSYLADENMAYVPFKLLNKTLKVDIDVSQIPCGAISALYLIDIDHHGDLGMGYNNAGSAYGTGYGDAQSPTDIKFVRGVANMHGNIGSSATEIDIFEANNQALAWTLHPCSKSGPCHERGCEDNCDRSGADMNPYRQGNFNFYGPGKILDSSEKFTVSTTFHTSHLFNGEEELVEVSQYYEQKGKRIEYPTSLILGDKGSITKESIEKQNSAFQNKDLSFERHGGFKSLTNSLKKGMTLVFSVWGDPVTHMQWLDGTVPPGSTKPGAKRGPCPIAEDTKRYLRRHQQNKVTAFFSNIRVIPATQ